jgi:hypothetical protein
VVQQQIQKKIGGDVGKWLSRAVRIVTQTISVNQLRHVCQDVDYTIAVSRTSPVTVSPAVNAVHVSTDVTIAGQAGFSGDVAKALKLDRKNFRGGVEVFADLAFDVDEHWCPKITGAANFRWTDKAQLEIVHNVWLGIEGQVGDKIKDRLNAAVADLQSKLRCDDVTTAVSKAWHLYSIPLNVHRAHNGSSAADATSAGTTSLKAHACIFRCDFDHRAHSSGLRHAFRCNESLPKGAHIRSRPTNGARRRYRR